MPNLRIVSDNAADRTTLSASTTAGALVAANLLTDEKADVWRATGTSATLTGTTATAESAACVHLPFCNLSPTATIRVRLYSDTAGTSQVLDTGTVLACPAAAIALRGWTALQAASAYAYGGGAHARIWFASTLWKRYVIDIVDTNNLQGYIEAARLVIGPYWTPTFNAEYGAGLLPVDSTTNYRTEAGSLKSDGGTYSWKVSLNLPALVPADRTAAINILRANGKRWPLLLSLFPQNADLELERDNTVWGKLTELSALTVSTLNRYALPVEIESI